MRMAGRKPGFLLDISPFINAFEFTINDSNWRRGTNFGWTVTRAEAWVRDRATIRFDISEICHGLRSNQDAPDEVPCRSWSNHRRDQVARVSWEFRIAISILVVFSGGLLLASAYIGARAEMDARKYFPLQFTDELSSRFYLQYVLFNRSIPLEIQRRVGISQALAWVAFVGCAAVAYLADNPVIAVLLLLACGAGVANTVVQWRKARR